jgi:hypothetical protein
MNNFILKDKIPYPDTSEFFKRHPCCNHHFSLLKKYPRKEDLTAKANKAKKDA